MAEAITTELSLNARACAMQTKDATEVVNEYVAAYPHYPFTKNAMLDIGSDTGYLLMNVIAPILGSGFKRIVGVDKNPQNVASLQEGYPHREGFEFKVLDIQTTNLPPEYHGKFDRVSSFYCLNCVRDHRQALENIATCLRRGGDCLLVFLGSNTTYEVFKALSKDPRFSDYLTQTNLDDVISPFHEHPVVEEEFDSLLEQEGFINRQVEVKSRVFSYEGFESFEENMRAIDVFHIPAELRQEYYAAFCNCLIAMGLQEKLPDKDEFKFTIKYRIVIASARKG